VLAGLVRTHAALTPAARSSKVPGVKIGLTDPRGAGLVRYFTEGALRAEVVVSRRAAYARSHSD